jgi:6-phosphofructokinase 1
LTAKQKKPFGYQNKKSSLECTTIESNEMNNIGVFTSGGDSPGMNACLRAVVRAGIDAGKSVYGIYRGYEGMIDGDILKMEKHDVSNIIQRGGTILKTARSKRFMTPEGRQQAFYNLKKHNIDSLVCIGGDGSFRGAMSLAQEFGVQVIGCPGTIDNDLFGTDYTIGFDTAINTAVTAVDKIRDTANSHNRLFFIEVMGRDAGFIALYTAIASGAESVLVPETKTDLPELIAQLEKGYRQNKTSAIIIVAEGDEEGGAYAVAEKVKERFNVYDTRVSVLGHIQRGGSPTAFDRVLASRMGHGAVQALLDGESCKMVGIVNRKVQLVPFEKATKHNQEVNPQLLALVDILSR